MVAGRDTEFAIQYRYGSKERRSNLPFFAQNNGLGKFRLFRNGAPVLSRTHTEKHVNVYIAKSPPKIMQLTQAPQISLSIVERFQPWSICSLLEARGKRPCAACQTTLTAHEDCVAHEVIDSENEGKTSSSCCPARLVVDRFIALLPYEKNCLMNQPVLVQYTVLLVVGICKMFPKDQPKLHCCYDCYARRRWFSGVQAPIIRCPEPLCWPWLPAQVWPSAQSPLCLRYSTHFVPAAWKTSIRF